MRRPNRRAINPARLAQLWAAYAEFRRGQIAPSTYTRDYPKFAQRIERMKKEAPGLATGGPLFWSWPSVGRLRSTCRSTIAATPGSPEHSKQG